jgi:exonuclease SbcD
MLKAIHTADFHINNQNIDEAKKCLEFIIETIKIEKPDIAIIAGDLFDSRNVKLESPAAMLLFDIITRMANLVPVSIVYGTPSHEGEATYALRYIKAKNPVFVSDQPEQYYMMDDNSFVRELGDKQPKLIISAVPQPTKKHFKSSGSIDLTNQEIAAAMTNIFGGFGATAMQYKAPHILIGHFSVSGAFLNNERQMVGLDIEISNDQIALANASLVALGHIHLHQKVGNNGFYSGSIFSTDWGEMDDKGLYLHIIDDAGQLQKSDFIQTPSRKRIKLQEDLTGAGELTTLTGFPLMEALLAGDAPVDVKDATVKVEFKVFQDEAAKINPNEIKKSLISSGAKEVDIVLVRIPRENVRSQKILRLVKLRDKLVEQAALKGEEVSERILLKADLLEAEESDKIVQNVWNKN